MTRYKAEHGEHGLNVTEDGLPMHAHDIQETLNRLHERLEISPQGDDKIDELEECIRHLRHQIGNLKALCKEADDYLNSAPSPRKNKISHGSILHGKFAEAWRDFDAHDHDGIPCGMGCSGHMSHPCEKCGRQWPVRNIKPGRPERPRPEWCKEGEIPSSLRSS